MTPSTLDLEAQGGLPRRSDVARLGTLAHEGDPSFARERPLFSTRGEFAHAEGGPLTRAFLDALPAEFANAPLVVDSMLCWLQRGTGMPTRWFHHELYPGKHDHAFGRANRERDAEHVACAFGAPSVREFLVGDVPDASLHLVANDDIVKRDARLRALHATGTFAKLSIEPGVLHRYGQGSFHRVLPTPAEGFAFFIRATRASARPRVDAFRNASGNYLTGPWEQEFTP